MKTLRRIWAALRRAAAQRIQGRKGTLIQCDGCREYVKTVYLMPIPDDWGQIEVRCEDCRKLWHRVVQDYFAHRTTEVAAARWDLERRSAASASGEADSIDELKMRIHNNTYHVDGEAVAAAMLKRGLFGQARHKEAA